MKLKSIRTVFFLPHFGLTRKTDDQTQSRPQKKAAGFLRHAIKGGAVDAPINHDRWFHEGSSARLKSRVLGLSHLYLTAGDFLLKQASTNF
jgi:hypothetical protein